MESRNWAHELNVTSCEALLKKPAGYVSAKLISDLTAMRIVEDYTMFHGAFPIDALVDRGFPKNVAGAKLHKLAKRGWISLQYKILKPGADYLREVESGDAA